MRISGALRRFVLMSLLLFSLSVLAAGCSGQGTVSGKVFYKGQPMTGGMVYFYPEAKSGNYASIIGTDGTYSIPKVPSGPAKISVVSASRGVPTEVFKSMGGKRAAEGVKKMGNIGKAASGGGQEAGKALDVKSAEPFPVKYTDPDKSGLTINVTGGSQTFDIKMD